MSLNSGFLWSKTHILCLVLIFKRNMKFLERILISASVLSFRHDENTMKEQIIFKNDWLKAENNRL